MTRRLLTLVRQQPIALAALFVALGGTSYAAAGSVRSNVTYACLHKGKLRVVASASKCKARETAISFRGERGPAGRDGSDGAPGPAGARGATGPAGAAGRTGAAGLDGADGTAGRDGVDGAAGRDGVDGAEGSAGAAGPEGPAGPAGADGETGPAGPQGPAGDDGETGPAGPQGPAGDDGETGPAGPAGADGETGPAGPAGADGETGPAGPAGATGPQGPAGPAGADGEAGPEGPAGPTLSAADVLSRLLTVDGPGSGVDADTVDGYHASQLITTSTFATAFDTRIATLFGNSPRASDTGINSGDCMLGTLQLTATNYSPPGYVAAAGQILPISGYSALFSLLGFTFGGNGSTTFALPDLRKHAPNGTTYILCYSGIFPQRS